MDKETATLKKLVRNNREKNFYDFYKNLEFSYEALNFMGKRGIRKSKVANIIYSGEKKKYRNNRTLCEYKNWRVIYEEDDKQYYIRFLDNPTLR